MAQASSSSTLERVEITGSRIKRVDAETSAPVQVITREQIERSGAVSVAEVLKRLPASNNGSFDENAIASFTPGAAGVSLRGLGAQATLVLINGRRTAPFGFALGGQQTFVDVNTIPLEMVERIEVLLDGASALYGSDAIGGVVNIILRRDFTGTQLAGSYGRTGFGDADTRNLSFTVGQGSLASDKYNVFANVTHTDRDPVKASARANTRTADFTRFGLRDRRSSYAYPGNLYETASTAEGTGAFLGTLGGCTPVADGSALDGRCVYDPTQHTDVQADMRRDALFVGGTVDAGRFEIFADASLNRTRFLQESPGYRSSDYYDLGTLSQRSIVLPVGHPQNPGTDPVALRYRFADVPQTTAVESTLSRLTLGARSTVFGWDSESALVHARSKTDQISNGFLRDSVLANGVLDPLTGEASPSFIFGNPGANDPALMAALYPTLRSRGVTETTSLDVRGTRELFQLPAGPLSVAVGAEVRHERFVSTPDALLTAGEISVLGASSADGSRDIESAYVEFAVPIVRSLEASLAARYDHYSDFGSSTTPKAGLKWKVLPNLALRTTYALGFRAPSLTETSSAPSTGFYVVRDPLLCPVVDISNPNCALGVLGTSGSNPALQPEKSRSFSYGFVYDFVDDWSFTANVFNIKRKNEIANTNIDYLLANEGQFPGTVVRDPGTNEIQSLNLQYTNQGSTEVSGFDLELKGKINAAEFGRFDVLATYNNLPHTKVRSIDGSAETDFAGTYGLPKERWQLGLGWEKGPWTTGLTLNYVGGYQRAYSPLDACPYAQESGLCNVRSWTTADLSFGYKGFTHLELGFVVLNATNRKAPLDSNMEVDNVLADSQYHNTLGRYFQLSAKYKF